MLGMGGYDLAEAAMRMREQLKVILLFGRDQAGSSGLPLIRKPFLTQDLKRTMAQYAGLC